MIKIHHDFNNNWGSNLCFPNEVSSTETNSSKYWFELTQDPRAVDRKFNRILTEYREQFR